MQFGDRVISEADGYPEDEDNFNLSMRKVTTPHPKLPTTVEELVDLHEGQRGSLLAEEIYRNGYDSLFGDDSLGDDLTGYREARNRAVISLGLTPPELDRSEEGATYLNCRQACLAAEHAVSIAAGVALLLPKTHDPRRPSYENTFTSLIRETFSLLGITLESPNGHIPSVVPDDFLDKVTHTVRQVGIGRAYQTVNHLLEHEIFVMPSIYGTTLFPFPDQDITITDDYEVVCEDGPYGDEEEGEHFKEWLRGLGFMFDQEGNPYLSETTVKALKRHRHRVFGVGDHPSEYDWTLEDEDPIQPGR